MFQHGGGDNMQLILNTFGASLHKSGALFEIWVGEDKKKISPKKVQSILITTGAHLSTDAIQMAVENNIDILFLDKYGNPYGRIWHDKLGSTARIRRKQIELSMKPEGLMLGIQWIKMRLNNQVDFLIKIRERRARLSSEITVTINTLKNSLKSFDQLAGKIEEKRSTIMGIEGSSGKAYWKMISKFLPERFQFKERSRNPAKDEFNCLLNYSYGVLYGLVEKACIIAGLDPYVGFIHTDNYNKTSLVFDIIEAYRIFAEETVIGLFSAKKVNNKLFDKYRGGLSLNQDGKKVLMERFNIYLDESIRYSGRNIKRRDTIQFDTHRFANRLLKISKY